MLRWCSPAVSLLLTDVDRADLAAGLTLLYALSGCTLCILELEGLQAAPLHSWVPLMWICFLKTQRCVLRQGLANSGCRAHTCSQLLSSPACCGDATASCPAGDTAGPGGCHQDPYSAVCGVKPHQVPSRQRCRLALQMSLIAAGVTWTSAIACDSLSPVRCRRACRPSAPSASHPAHIAGSLRHSSKPVSSSPVSWRADSAAGSGESAWVIISNFASHL